MSRLDRLNAALRGRRPALLGAAGVRELLARPALDARLKHLAALRPGLLDATAPPRDLDALEAALRDGLRAEADRMLRAVEGARPRRALAAALAAERPLGLGLDREALPAALAACRGEDGAVLRAHLEDRVDAWNAATLLVLATGGAAPAAPALEAGFVPGGRRIGAARFRALAAAEPGAARAGVAAAFPAAAAALGRPWTAERALERALGAALRRAALLAPLSVAVPLLYLAERRAELRRIAIVLRGAELGLPGDALLELAEA